MRQPAERHGVGPIHGALLPDRATVPAVRCRSDFSLSVGGRAETPWNVRIRRGADLHLDTCGRSRLRLAARRAGLGLATLLKSREEFPEEFPVELPMLIEKLKQRFGAEILG